MRTRKVVAVWAALALLLAGLSLRPARADDTGGDVPMFRGNPAHTGEMPNFGRAVVRNRAEDNWGSPYSLTATDQVLYIGTHYGLIAVDALTHGEKWRLATYPSWEVLSSPAVAGNVVYLASGVDSVYALDAQTGAELWHSLSIGELDSSPAVANGVVYIGSGDHSVYALDATNGSVLWSFSTGDNVYASAAAVNDDVYIGSWDGNLYALDAKTGQESWRFATDGNVVASPTVIDGVVYFYSSYGTLYAAESATGREIWHFRLESNASDRGTPLVANGVVYLGTYALDAESGTVMWHTFCPFSSWSRTPILFGGLVFSGGCALNAANGNVRWLFGAGGDSGPTLGDGIVYFGQEETELVFAFDAVHGSELWHFSIGESGRAAVATPQAISEMWADYIAGFGNLLSTSSNIPAGFTIGDAQVVQTWDALPTGWPLGALYPVDVPADGDVGAIVLTIYESSHSAQAAYEAVTKGLRRAGWKAQDGDGIDHEHECLLVAQASGSTANCYVLREKAIIVTSSFLPLDAADAVLMNAVDLAIYADGIYDQIPPPA